MGGDASCDPCLHHGLCVRDLCCAAGNPVPIPALLQPKLNMEPVSSLEVDHNLPLLWNFWVQLPLQHDLHIQILQDAGRELIQRENF